MSAADFLLTPSLQRVLGATLLQPEREFTLKELIELAGKGRGGTQLQIERLLKAGVLVEAPRLGNMRRIRANREHFLFQELRSIARKSFGLVEPIRDTVQRMAPGVSEAFIFGSVAKGVDTGSSDVDLMLVGQLTSSELYRLESELAQTLGRSVHINAYEPDEWAHLVSNDPVVAQIAEGPQMKVLPA